MVILYCHLSFSSQLLNVFSFLPVCVICEVVGCLLFLYTHGHVYIADGALGGFASLWGFTAARAAWQKRQCRIANLATLSLDLAALQSPVATCIGNQYNVAKSVTWMAVPSSCPHGAAGSSQSPNDIDHNAWCLQAPPHAFYCSFQVNALIFGRIKWFPSVSVKRHKYLSLQFLFARACFVVLQHSFWRSFLHQPHFIGDLLVCKYKDWHWNVFTFLLPFPPYTNWSNGFYFNVQLYVRCSFAIHTLYYSGKDY